MKVIVLGASPNPNRYSYKAVSLLKDKGYDVIAVGIRDGEINGVPIVKGKPQIPDIHTVTLYLNPQRQREYYDWIISLNPQRVVFNPGTENPEFQSILKEKGINFVEACTLVMLTIGVFDQIETTEQFYRSF